MILQELAIHKFRNLGAARLQFSPAVNFIFGDNAQGKTNLIEAVHLLCLAKSFRTHEDEEIVPFGGTGYFIEGFFQNEKSIVRRVAVLYEKSSGKQISVDEKRLQRYSALTGEFPAACLWEGDREITAGSPQQRRRFFNVLLSQTSRSGLEDLKQYDHILRQRNSVLSAVQAGRRGVHEQLEIWDEQLIQLGVRVMRARKQLVDELNPVLESCYRRISGNRMTLRILYQPNVEYDEKSPEEAFRRELERLRPAEIRRGVSLVGPHRDDFVFWIDEVELRKFGSAGEHKSALISLKAAEVEILRNRTETSPIVLLDDLFSELDRERSAAALALFDAQAQIFITGTSLDFQWARQTGLDWENAAAYCIENGQVRADDGA